MKLSLFNTCSQRYPCSSSKLTPQQPPEPDVEAEINGRRIGIEVTDFHGDEGQSSNPGSIQRSKEVQISQRANSRPYAMWTGVDPGQAVVLRIEDKVQKAKKYSTGNLDELWLLIAASLPQLGAMVSTYILPPAVNLEELNNRTHNLLRSSAYAKVYLLLVMGNGFYEWSPSEKWCVLQAPSEITTLPWSKFKEISSDPAWLSDPRRKARSEAMKALKELRAMKQK